MLGRDFWGSTPLIPGDTMTRLMLDQLPNLFILGAAKAGTSSLYEYLAQHPSIFAPTPKEPLFFDNDEAYTRGLEWYGNTFFPTVPRFVSNTMASWFGIRPRVFLRNFIRLLPGKPPSPPEHVVEQLRSAYHPDILDLSELIGRDLSGWLEPAEKVSHCSTIRPARSRAKEA